MPLIPEGLIGTCSGYYISKENKVKLMTLDENYDYVNTCHAYTSIAQCMKEKITFAIFSVDNREGFTECGKL